MPLTTEQITQAEALLESSKTASVALANAQTALATAQAAVTPAQTAVDAAAKADTDADAAFWAFIKPLVV